MSDKPTYEELEQRVKELESSEVEYTRVLKALRESEILLEEAQELAKIGSWFWVVETDKVRWSKTLYEITGCDPKQPPPAYKEHHTLYTKESWESLSQAVKNCANKGEPYDLELNMIRPDGQVRCTSTQGKAVTNESGHVVRLHGTVQDITERKQFEVALQKAHEELELREEDRTRELKDVARQLQQKILDYDSSDRALLDSEVRFREMFDNMSNCVAIYQAADNGNDFLVKDFNKAAEKVDGMKRQDIIGESVLKIFPGVKELGLFDVFQKVWQTGTSMHHPISFYNDESLVGWRENFVYKLPTDEIVAIYEDVTSRKQAEEELSLQSEIINRMTGGVYLARMDGIIVYTNPKFVEMFGYDSGEMIGQHASIVNAQTGKDPKETAKEILDILDKEGVWQGEIQNIRKDGTPFWCYASVTVFDNPKYGKVMAAVHTDITERKQVEEDLVRERDFSESLINTAQAIILFLNPDGTIQSFNPYMEKICGYKLEEVKGKDWFEKFLPNQDWQAIRVLFKKAISDIQTSGNVNPIVTKDGHEVFIEWYDKTLKDSKGEVVGLLSIGLDVTARKRIEEEKNKLEIQLRQAHKMEAIGTMAGGIAHDFNNILAAIIGYADMARDDIPDYSPAKYQIEQVLKAGNRAKDLVSHILTFSRMSGLTQGYANINLSPIVKEVLKFQRSIIPTTIEIQSDIDQNCGQINGNPDQIHQVIMNFCTNAMHAMEETGGILKVDLHKTDLSSNDLKAEPNLYPGCYIRLSAADTGAGLTPEIIDRIFDPYFTTKEVGKGSGMGLAVVQGVVKHHGGFVKVESEPGKGSTFNVFFPRIEELIQEEVEETEGILTGTERILFIDDEEMLADIGKTELERLGYSVTAKTDSFEALDLFQIDPTQFDLVITDQTMPNIPGSELAKKLLKIRPDIPIILCTGYSSMINEVKAQRIGIREYTMKPVKKNVIANLIRKVLDGDKSVN